jgi:HEPN domain-containing protein
MNVQPEVLEMLRQWVRKAEHDLEAAKPYDTACFHCQQVVEKYLKALLTRLGIPAPRTHDLERLAALLPAEQRLSVPVARLVAINPYAVDVRYADDWREPDRDEAIHALETAEAVRAEALSLLPKEVVA